MRLCCCCPCVPALCRGLAVALRYACWLSLTLMLAGLAGALWYRVLWPDDAVQLQVEWEMRQRRCLCLDQAPSALLRARGAGAPLDLALERQAATPRCQLPETLDGRPAECAPDVSPPPSLPVVAEVPGGRRTPPPAAPPGVRPPPSSAQHVDLTRQTAEREQQQQQQRRRQAAIGGSPPRRSE